MPINSTTDIVSSLASAILIWIVDKHLLYVDWCRLTLGCCCDLMDMEKGRDHLSRESEISDIICLGPATFVFLGLSSLTYVYDSALDSKFNFRDPCCAIYHVHILSSSLFPDIHD